MISRRNRGFTLVELLVVISIIGMLMALVLPAVQNSKEIARQSKCMNNLKQIATGMNSFHSVEGRFPGYLNAVGVGSKPVGWPIMLFPYIDRGDLWNQWSQRAFPNTGGNNGTRPSEESHSHAFIDIYTCPSNPPQDDGISPLGYAVNAGYGGVTEQELENRQTKQADGVFHNHYPTEAQTSNISFDAKEARVVSINYLSSHDGAAHTILASENMQWPYTWRTWTPTIGGFDENRRCSMGILWFNGADSVGRPQRRINFDKTFELPGTDRPSSGNHNAESPHDVGSGANIFPEDLARPSSNHAQGVNVIFCDGHGRFISEQVDYAVYMQLMTPAGNISSVPGMLPLDESKLQ